MKLLLDTHILLWAAAASRHLPAEAAALLEDPANHLLFSAASIWEVSIKSSLGRTDLRIDPGALRRGLLANDYTELPITGDHALAVRTLPEHHKDPFDRILVAQAITEAVTLLTSDQRLAKYAGPIRHF